MKSRIIIDENLKSNILSDLRLVGVITDFDLEFRGYSSSLWGRYFPKEKKVVLYILKTKEGERYPYGTLLDVALHESLHHYQHHHQEGFVRRHGVMHDITFNKLYAEKVYKLKELEVIKENEEAV